jgi:hypothetical protein
MSVVLARTNSASNQPSAEDYDNGQAQCQLELLALAPKAAPAHLRTT